MKSKEQHPTELSAKAGKVATQVNKVILGKEKEVKDVMLAFLAGEHVLLEDIPRTGKTTLALAFSKAMRPDCKRVQFTSDVMPSDLTGFSIYRREEEKFVCQPGSVFCNLLLADEINRTSPKTRSALLEVMQERKVSVEGVTRDVPKPYVFVVSDGRTEESAGLTLFELAGVIRELNCHTAYNLDGGGSSTMWFMGEVVNHPTSGRRDGERRISDIVYIGE